MASLTSARARNRGVSGSPAVHHDSQHETGHFHDIVDDEDGDKKLEKPYRSLHQPSSSTAHKKATPSHSLRPFGSSAHVPAANAAATSGWVTSGTYVDKGKGKAGSNTIAKTGNGPLRAYGGGLGSVGQGEFKLLVMIVALASVVRLWKLDRPSSVVFDEVHFGGFATKYIKQRFFMDVHPPLAKLMITFVAWFAGYRGNFDFKDIGKEYGPDHVPYIAMRLLPACLGIAVVPIAYLTLRSLGCRPATCLLASLLLTFENGLITQSRLILLDSPLLFYTALTVFFWVGFCAEDARKAGSSCAGPFSRTWWAWLAMTGLCLGLTLSCKWVGLFTIATVGVATIEQMWQILGDTKISMKTVGRHFVARAICLIGIPISVYMWWFWIHFLVLSHSGDGDGFMSSEFQHTLQGHGMPDTFADVALGSRITLRHLHTQGGYLHSHPHNYPGGSKQQQITLYPHKDDNNDWIVLNETQHYGKDNDPSRVGPITYLTDKMFIRLHHPSSGKKLHSHDIRPPVSEVDFQNEVSAYGFPDFEGDANDNFQVEIVPEETDKDKYAKKRVRALRTKFKLRHVLTGCYLFSHKVKLPDWAFDQQEVTCNKNPTKANSIWYVETNSHPLMDPKAEKVNYRKPGFLSKFTELQAVMWRTNAGLTDRHAYDSRPHQWPYLRRGINFWVKDHRQIYLLGNPVIWWISSFSVLLYVATRGFIILREKRGYKDLHNTTVQFYDRLCGFLFLGWVMHYFPFFIMQRQLFLHHYLPALYFSILLFASVFDLATSTLRPQFRVQMAAIIFICALWAFQHWAPLVYAGKWTKQDCEDAKWLKNWDFSCNDFHQKYSDYDNVIQPTPSKPVVQVGSGVPAVEAETPSSAETTVEPAKDAFAIDDHEGKQAPQSQYMMPEMIEKASAAHAEAEKKEDAERKPGEVEKINETEPTNVPGAELPVEIVEPLVKQEVQEEINNEAPVPLEEAAPTPTNEDKTAIPVASIADPEEKAGVEQIRLAEVDAANARERLAAIKAGEPKLEEAFENEAIPVPEEEPLKMPAAEQTREEPVVKAPARLKKVPQDPVADKDEDVRPILQDAREKEVPVGNEGVKAAIKPKGEPAKRPAVALDPDEAAAVEERAEFQQKEQNKP